MKFRIFISSVQKEFARERREIARYIRKDALFGKNPQKYFINSEVKCAQFYGTEVEKPMADYKIYRGDVFELADQATYFVMTHTSLPPNELIAGPMYLKGYIEKMGTGTEDVAKLCAKSGLPAPGFTEGVDFRAVLKRKSLGGVAETQVETQAAKAQTTEVTTEAGMEAGEKNGGTLNGTLNGRLNPTDAKVLTYICNSPGCRAQAIITDLSIPRDTLNKVIKRLSMGGFIERRGSKKTGGYFIVEHQPH